MLQFLISSQEVMRYMSLNPNDEEIILATLRTYPEFMNANRFLT
jgi:ATP-dependent DNA helicase RecQ